jgi:hypothetical protein
MSNIALKNTAMHGIEVMEKAYKFAEIMAKSDIIPSHYREKPANVFIAVQSGLRMNIDPMLVMQNTFVVGGKLGMGSAFAISLANQSGLFDAGIRYRIEGEGDSLRVTAYTNLKKTGEEISYTIGMKEAKAENWTKNPKYRTLPELMLRYRAATLLIRTHAPEVLNGMQMAEELKDVEASKTVTESKAKTMNEKLNEKFDLLPPIEEPLESPFDKKDLLAELTWLIDKHDVSEDLIGKWCDKAEVETIDELDQDKMQSCIDYINTNNHYIEN